MAITLLLNLFFVQVADSDVAVAIKECAARIRNLGEFSFTYKWRDGQARSDGRIERNSSGWRFSRSVPLNAKNKVERQIEHLCAGGVWRRRILDLATKRLLRYELPSATPTIEGDFSPLEAFGMGFVPGENSNSVLAALEHGTLVSHKIANDPPHYVVDIEHQQHSFQIRIDRSPNYRFLGSVRRTKDVPSVRVVNVLEFALVEGVNVPVRSSMGYQNHSAIPGGAKFWPLEIADFTTHTSFDADKIASDDDKLGVDVFDERIGSLIKGKRSAQGDFAKAKQAVKQLNSDETKMLLAELPPGVAVDASQAPTSWLGLPFWIGVSIAAVGILVWLLWQRLERAKL